MEKSKPKPKSTDSIDEDGEDAADIIDIGGVLSKFGISKSEVKRVRLGRGLVGKLTSSLMLTVGALAAIGVALAARNGSGYVIASLIIASMIVFVYSRYIASVKEIAERHPELALLEGAELIAYRKMQLDLSTKTSPEAVATKKVEADPARPKVAIPSASETQRDADSDY